MKRLCLAALLALLFSIEARGEQPTAKVKAPDHVISLGQVTPTPEMWFYDQAMRQHADPKAMVRQKAEFDLAQRQRRLAAQHWFGVSNARPSAGITPFQGTYSTTWVGNTTNPAQWAGQGTPVYQSRPRMLIW